MLSHGFPKEFQCRLLVARLRDVAFQNLAFVIDRTPEVVPLAVDLHKNLIQMPLPTARLHPFDPALPDLGGEKRPKPVPPEPNRLVADLDAALVQKILDIPERQRKPNIQHHRQADNLGAGLEVLEWGAFGHARTLSGTLPRHKQSSSDRTCRDRDAAVRVCGLALGRSGWRGVWGTELTQTAQSRRSGLPQCCSAALPNRLVQNPEHREQPKIGIVHNSNV